ncbi:hypothetical protein GCM10029964_095300 [Kibdelosporangium lantanae]
MKWARGVHYLADLARRCAELATAPDGVRGLPVVELWAFGDVLGAPREIEVVNVAIVVDLVDVPWLGEPVGAEHWTNMTRMRKNPIVGLWRSVHAPVWNHHIVRPARLWTVADGVAEDALAAISDGKGGDFRLPAPSAAELRERLDAEMAVSLRSLREQTRTYDERRWRPGNMTPVADALWRASNGYLDVLDASQRV